MTTVSTTRSGIVHLQNMKDVEFVTFAREIIEKSNGKLDNVPVSLKVDGLGGRFGKSEDGKPFFEGSRTGPLFAPKSFSKHAKENGHDEIRLNRASHYDDIWDIIVGSSLMDSIPANAKVVCELFYNPMGELTKDGIRFVSISYDTAKLGSLMTIVPLDVLESSTGNRHPRSVEIITALLDRSTSKIKVVSPKLKLADSIDVGTIIDPMKGIDTRVLTSLKKADATQKTELKSIVKICKDALAKFILDHKSIVNKDVLGPNIEGLVLNINGKNIKITTPEFKSSKQLVESVKKTIVMTFGRFQPPTIGHGVLISKVVDTAKKLGADNIVFASKTVDRKQNPLPVYRKVHYMQLMFPGVNIVAASNEIRTIVEAAKSLNSSYSDLILVAGSDRVQQFKALLDNYNGKLYNYDSIEVVSAGNRDPDSDTIDGMSGTKMRAAAASDNKAIFSTGMPKHMTPAAIGTLMKEIRFGLGLDTAGIKYKDLKRKLK